MSVNVKIDFEASILTSVIGLTTQELAAPSAIRSYRGQGWPGFQDSITLARRESSPGAERSPNRKRYQDSANRNNVVLSEIRWKPGCL
jgi:hypothetical protein